MPNININETPATVTPMFTAQRILTHAEILSFVLTPPEIIAAPGAGKIVLVTDFFVGPLDDSNGAYGNVDNQVSSYFELIYGAGYLEDASGPIDNLATVLTGGFLCRAPKVVDADSYDLANLVNQGIYLLVENNGLGNFTGGGAGNTLKITTTYSIIDS